jgi:ADP-ribose pyrophosphatase YjhB (NUDIX family)
MKEMLNMNITFKTTDGTFLFRVGAIVIQDGCLLTLEREDHFAIPGGRVMLHEDVETAVLREVQEELGVQGKLVRGLWMNQCFYHSAFRNAQVHEICVYFLIDIDRQAFSGPADQIVRYEEEKCHTFRWIPLDSVKNLNLYPRFIRKEIQNLPDTLTLITER